MQRRATRFKNCEETFCEGQCNYICTGGTKRRIQSEGLRCLPVAGIVSIVSMQPLPRRPEDPENLWFVVEKSGLDDVQLIGYEGDVWSTILIHTSLQSGIYLIDSRATHSSWYYDQLEFLWSSLSHDLHWHNVLIPPPCPTPLFIMREICNIHFRQW